MSETLKNNFEASQESESKWDELMNLPKPDNYEAKPLTAEQIDEIRKQDAEKRKEWDFNNQHDIVRKKRELEELKAAQERGDETITFERRTKIDGQARDAEGKPYIRRDTEFVTDSAIENREDELRNLEAIRKGGVLRRLGYTIKQRRTKGKVGHKNERVVPTDVPQPPEK